MGLIELLSTGGKMIATWRHGSGNARSTGKRLQLRFFGASSESPGMLGVGDGQGAGGGGGRKTPLRVTLGVLDNRGAGTSSYSAVWAIPSLAIRMH
jgi:hypothetical protein